MRFDDPSSMCLIRQLTSDNSSSSVESLTSEFPRARFETLLRQCLRIPEVCPCSLDKYLDHRCEWIWDPLHFQHAYGAPVPPYLSPSELKQICLSLSNFIKENDTNVSTYSELTENELKQCLQGRGIVLPRKADRKSYITALETADSMTTFKFLELPTEIRLQIYSSALLVDTEIRRGVTDRQQMVKPPLLQTCQLIRKEGSSIFYRLNRFVVTMSPSHYYCSPSLLPLRITYEARSWFALLQDNIEDLRHISLVLEQQPRAVKMVDINILGKDATSWELVVSKHTRTCNTMDRIKETVADYLRAWHFHEPECLLEMSKEQLIVVQNAIDQVWKVCSLEGRLKLSMQGIEIMIDAARKVLQNV